MGLDELDECWNLLAEMFTEGRARCLGYGADEDFDVMSCDEIDSVFSGTEQADQIIEMSLQSPVIGTFQKLTGLFP